MTATASTISPALTGSYTLDTTHSRLGFSARHAMVTKVRGAFADFAGTAVLDAEDPSRSHAEVTIQVASVDTGNAQRDEHLRTNDFFDAATYPEIRFVSTKAEALGEDNYRLTGDLTIKDVTKSVAVDFEFTGLVADPWGNQRAGFEGKAVINRKDWGVNFNAALEAGGVLVSEKITLEFDISAIKA
ncbi:MAG TPA: YceI family protein [Sporichthya sp.]|nr:YceI family protein [Sporichthya sp.]